MKTGIYRQVAINKLSSPEELDNLLQVTTAKGWIALTGIGMLIVCILGWGIFGRLPTKLPGQQCILVKNGGVNVLTTAAAGRLSDLAVEVGDQVTRGQIIGRLEQSDLLQKIHASEAHLSEVQAQYDQANALATQNASLRGVALAQQRQTLNNQLETDRQKENLLTERIETQQSLLNQGLITKQTLIGTKLDLAAVEQDAQGARAQLKQLEISDMEAKKQSNNEVVQLHNQLEDVKRSLAMMVRETKDFASIVSPYSGRILEVKAAEGQLVERGTPLVSIESSGADVNEIEAFLYLPAADGKKVSRGMRVEISPSTAKREEFGFLPALVASVADYPSTDQGLMRVLGNEKLVQQLTGTIAPIQVRASLIPSANNASHYEWSTRSGPPFEVHSGTSCSAMITVAEQRPIELLLPIFKNAAQLD